MFRPNDSLAVLAVVGILLFAGCPRRTRPDADPTRTSLEPGIYHLSSGDRLESSELARRLVETRYVVFGEQHTSEWQHRRQADLFRRLAERRGASFSLGMEMFQRPFQKALDAYVAGRIDESEMLKRTEWKSRWGVDPALYRPLWSRAREQGAPIVALNLRRELSRKIARVGLEGLSEKERESLPREIDTSIDRQREYVRRAFERHGMADHMKFEHFLQAQASWDETMAETAVQFVESSATASGMFVAAGRAHARKDFGIPARIRRRLDAPDADSTASILPISRGDPGSLPLDLETLRRKEVADYIWVGPQSENRAGD